MATRTEPTVGETSGALFRALRSVGVEPDLAYSADDEVRSQAGQNVITVLNARFDELSAKIEAVESRVDIKIDSLRTELSTGLDAVNSRIDTLQRVIWPLVVLLASTVFGLLYRVLTVPQPGP
ncbi:MAG: hypothetical protein OXL36_14955 [Bryobacterales bacterium]|nr:hypothetical protein [Bryobacterales bacterium]MDE0295852.1 hypothetical protein [Bryobacterales bacterium]